MTIRFVLVLCTCCFLSLAANAQAASSVDTSALRIFEKVDIEASFPGGEMAWRKFLEKNLRADVPLRRGAPAGSYTVWVQFVVDKEGNVSSIKPLTSWGYGMEDEIVRVLKKSPKWMPASQDGIEVRAYRKQPVTFVIEEVGKKHRG